MTFDSRLVGIGAGILAVVLMLYLPVSKRRVNQVVVNLVIAVLIFVAVFAFFEIQLAFPIATGLVIVVILARFVVGSLRSAIYTNFTRYLRRDYWQRKVGQGIIGSSRRRRRQD